MNRERRYDTHDCMIARARMHTYIHSVHARHARLHFHFLLQPLEGVGGCGDPHTLLLHILEKLLRHFLLEVEVG